MEKRRVGTRFIDREATEEDHARVHLKLKLKLENDFISSLTIWSELTDFIENASAITFRIDINIRSFTFDSFMNKTVPD